STEHPPRRKRRDFLLPLGLSRDGFGGFLPQPPYFSGGPRRGFTFGLPAHRSFGQKYRAVRKEKKEGPYILGLKTPRLYGPPGKPTAIMATRRLYYDDSFQREFTARVLSCEPATACPSPSRCVSRVGTSVSPFSRTLPRSDSISLRWSNSFRSRSGSWLCTLPWPYSGMCAPTSHASPSRTSAYACWSDAPPSRRDFTSV